MSVTADVLDKPLGPWNPGIESTLPRHLLPLSTLLAPDNTASQAAGVLELADFTGLAWDELSWLKPQRLALHEVLIRVTGDLSVPDGDKYGDLGINFRAMTHTILSKYIEPQMPAIVAAHEQMLEQARALLERELSDTLFPPPAPKPPEALPSKGVLSWFKSKPNPAPAAKAASEPIEARDHRFLAGWKRRASETADPLQCAVYAALSRVASAIYRRHGRLIGSKAIFETLTLTCLSNGYGSERIGLQVAPLIGDAARGEGYRVLPIQARPLVLNVKGASASGKSTMRPLQRDLARRLSASWDEFALVSPDIWRKYLLDYDSLGDARRYAGTLSGHELAIVDRKLDRYMAAKGESVGMSHLLIDRFRFDSFASEPGREDGSRLLTRFGHVVYMYFMITPPEATVERAYKRGEKFGRYKAVDDLLDHNIEAFNGMPRLFFTWVCQRNKQVHSEFLDNSVSEGETPRTVAFGWNGEINVLDIRSLLNVDRYAKINVGALSPEQVYLGGEALAPERNTQFLRQCARTLPVLSFAEFATGRIYARLENGIPVWSDPKLLAEILTDADNRAGLLAIAPGIEEHVSAPPVEPRYLDWGGAHTLGAWGEGKSMRRTLE